MELYERPANLFVAGFLGSANMLDGTLADAGTAFVTRGGLRIALPGRRDPVPAAPKLVFRPQDAALGQAPPGAVALDGVVAHREFLGALIRYTIRVGTDEIAVDAPFMAGAALQAIGAPVTVSVRVDALRLLAS